MTAANADCSGDTRRSVPAGAPAASDSGNNRNPSFIKSSLMRGASRPMICANLPSRVATRCGRWMMASHTTSAACSGDHSASC